MAEQKRLKLESKAKIFKQAEKRDFGPQKPKEKDKTKDFKAGIRKLKRSCAGGEGMLGKAKAPRQFSREV